jgi:hypothetical protein
MQSQPYFSCKVHKVDGIPYGLKVSLKARFARVRVELWISTVTWISAKPGETIVDGSETDINLCIPGGKWRGTFCWEEVDWM